MWAPPLEIGGPRFGSSSSLPFPLPPSSLSPLRPSGEAGIAEEGRGGRTRARAVPPRRRAIGRLLPPPAEARVPPLFVRVSSAIPVVVLGLPCVSLSQPANLWQNVDRFQVRVGSLRTIENPVDVEMDCRTLPQLMTPNEDKNHIKWRPKQIPWFPISTIPQYL